MIPAETVAHIEMVVQQYIADGIPELVAERSFADPASGDYKHPLWDMVRELKDDRHMASLPGYSAVPTLERVINDLTALGYSDVDEAYEDLEALWDKAKLGYNEGPLAVAVRMNNSSPQTFQTNHF